MALCWTGTEKVSQKKRKDYDPVKVSKICDEYGPKAHIGYVFKVFGGSLWIHIFRIRTE